ncbi:MAG TPA: biopolymer transporter ExbD [Arenicellales bacterium]|nr:biopolymer transporter ExbD [Arenicellales bacterium]
MRFEPPRPRNDEERVLPLINVVFLLLIFFMLAGRIAATDPFRVEPPNSTSEGTVQVRKMILLIGADGRLALDGEVMAAPALRDRIQSVVADEGNPGLLLKADGGAEATRVVGVMELLREAGLERVELLTVPEGR